MSKSIFSTFSQARNWLTYSLLLTCAVGALAQPFQAPLLNRTGNSATPNLVLNLDESGSMLYQHMPEGDFTVAEKTINLAGDRSLRMHPLDNRTFSGTYRGSWPANIGAAALSAELLYQQQLRASDVNTLYYNPETTYLPWVKKNAGTGVYDGVTRFPAASLATAYFNPMVTSGNITYVSKGAHATTNSNNLNNIPLPTGYQVGDLLMCFGQSNDGNTHTAGVGGWTQLYNVRPGGNNSASAFYRVATSNSHANFAITHAGNRVISQCYAFRGVNTTNPIDVSFAAAHAVTAGNSNTINGGSMSTVTPGGMLLLASHVSSNLASSTTAISTSGGGTTWTVAGIQNHALGAVSLGLSYSEELPIPTTIASSTAKSLGNALLTGPNTGVLIALRPAAPPAYANLGAATGNVTADWCLAATGACTTSSLSYTPMLYYRLQKTGSTLKDPTNQANYDRYDLTNATVKIGSAATTTLVSISGLPTRTDCAAGVCTLAQERQNFANWFVYHRSRLLVAQGAIAESFWNIAEDKLRVGWGHIHKGYSTLDNGENVATVVQGVRDFTTARKDSLFNFARTITLNSGTPLRSALYGVGEYYEKESPWADDPSNVTIKIPADSLTAFKDCRRAYHLLITDGLWNTTGAPIVPIFPPGIGPSTTLGNADAGTYPLLTSKNGVPYEYKATGPYSDTFPDTLADYASYFFNRDLRPTLDNGVTAFPPNKLTWQGMVNFVVGIGLKGTLDPTKDLYDLTDIAVTETTPAKPATKFWTGNRVDDLWHAAVNSEGKYFTARNSMELATSLTTALAATAKDTFKEAGVATTTSVLEAGNRKYVPIYTSIQWTGDIRAFELDANGATTKFVGVGGGPEGSLWSVAEKITSKTWSSRNIYTWNSTTSAPSLFTWADMGAANQTAMGPGAGNADLVNYLRGDQTKEGDGSDLTKPYRKRLSVLGDFINSNPVLVKNGADLGYQSLTVGGSTYNTYRTTVKAPRTGVLFAGSNAGTVHAFIDQVGTVKTNGGHEIFAYVPKLIYGNLTKLADQNYGSPLLYHQYFIDGAFSETDAYIKATPSSPGAEWRNVLIGSLGAGGRGVLAFDVTDMTAPGAANVKWEFGGDNDLGYVSAPIEVGVLKNGTWVAIFGNGPMSPNGKAVLFVVNLETGVAQKLEVNSSTGNGLGGVGVQRDADGYITNVFAGDLTGALWKLNYDATAASKFVVDGSAAMFNATTAGGAPQPITQPPMVFDHSQGGKMIVFGTGKLVVEADRDTPLTNSMYGVWDKPTDTFPRPLSRSLLQVRTIAKIDGAGGGTFYTLSGDDVTWVSQRGWVIDLVTGALDASLADLRVIYPPQRISAKLVLMSSVSPALKATVCGVKDGEGANFILPIETGKNPTNKMFDTNGDGKFDNDDLSVAGYSTSVDGIDSVITSATAGGKCKPDEVLKAIESTEGAVLACIPLDNPPGAGTSAVDRIWRQIINPPIR